MPLSRALAAALAVFCGVLSAAAVTPVEISVGRCVGAAGAPAPAPTGGVPFDPSRRADWHKLKEGFNLLGYAVGSDGRTLHGPGGNAVTDREFAWLTAPADMSRERVPEPLWAEFVQMGYRLDERTCVLSMAKGPLTRIDYLALAAIDKRQRQRDALEHLKVRLSGLNASAPIPAGLAAEIKTLADAGSPLPASVQRALAAPGANVGSLTRGVDASYADSTRYFDGMDSLAKLALKAAPLVPGVNTPAKLAVPQESDERIMGRMVSAGLVARYAQNRAGRDMLDHFRGKDGTAAFPPMLIIKTNQSPADRAIAGAFFSPDSGAVVMNYWDALNYMRRNLAPEELKRSAEQLSTPRGLRAYLQAHPKEREQLLDQLDEVFYHELVHAWQDRRDKLTVEMMRGNLPGNNIISREHEAYREQCRYVLERAAQDPRTLARSGYLGYCLGMLKDYDAFRDGITKSYVGTFAGNSTIADVVKIQRERESMSRRLMGEGLYQRSVQTLKLLGMAQGDEMLTDFRTEYARRESAFITQTLPRLRSIAVSALVPALRADRKDALALAFLVNVPAGTAGVEAARLEVERGLLPRLARPGDDFPLLARIDVYGMIYADRNAGKLAWPPEVAAAYLRDAAELETFIRAEAAKAPSPARRAELLSKADLWGQTARPKAAPK